MRPINAIVLSSLLAALSAQAARADINYTTFTDATNLQLVTNAAINSGRIRLTPNTTNQVGAAWHTVQQKVADGFTCTFTFRIPTNQSGGADGFAFVIQNSSVTAIGGGGCRIGYHGITNSLAVEFDTYTSGTCDAGDVADPNDNHVSVHTRGALPNSAEQSASIGINTNIPTLWNNTIRTVRIDYTPGQMDVYIDDMTTPRISAPADLTTLGLNAGKAWIGFTAATGGASEAHDILTWSFIEGAPAGSGNPRTPTITEPQFDGRIVNPQDVHMETNPFFSSGGHDHACTDWEIWSVSPVELVWQTLCISGIERLHTHLGDGQFLGSHAGRRDLFPSTNYQLRARHRDDSGASSTEWSSYAMRSFVTGAPGASLPLSMRDVVNTPTWTDAVSGVPVLLPPAGAGAPATMIVGAADGSVLLSFIAGSSGGTLVTNPVAMPGLKQVRLRLSGGSTGLLLAASQLRMVDENCTPRTVSLPAVILAPNAERFLWVSVAGSTYVGTAAQDHAEFSTIARASEHPFLPTQPNYVIEKFATGLQLPVTIAFVPNPGLNPNDVFFYVTELYGTIKMVTRDGTVSNYATGLLNFNPTGAFPGSGEQGLTGLVVDPLNGNLYATLLNDNPDDGGTNHFPKVVRFQSTDGGRTMSSMTTLMFMTADPQGQSHQISSISFGPDDLLYVHMGDGFVASTAQNMDVFRGKILRIDRSGQPVPSNPFYDLADGITARDYIYCSGVRNPFGGAWRNSDGKRYVVENGPSIDRMFQLVAGRNMGYTGSDASMITFAMYNWSPSHAPVSIVFPQTSVFNGSGFPAEKMDVAIVTESGPTYGSGPQPLGKRIVEFGISPAGTITSGPTTLVEYAGAGQGTCVAIAAGPDGLYFSDLYKDLDAASPIDRGANIWRIRYTTASACCRADFDGVNNVTIDDLFLFLNAYFSGDPRADMNQAGGVTIDDLFLYINTWFTGC